MTISNTKAKSVYETNGERREWEIGFDFDSNVSKLNIILEDREGYQTVVEDNYLIEDGVVIYPSLESELDPIAEGYKIILFRSTPNTQEIDLRDNVTEKGLDKLTLQVQELSEQVDRAVKVPLVEEGVNEYQDLVLKVREERDSALEQIKEATSVVSDYTQASALNAVISKEEAERAVEAGNVSVRASYDAEAFAIKAENLANEAHNAVSAYVNGLGAMRNAVLDLGVFEDNQRRASSSIIDFDFEPLDVFVRFSDSEKKMWINGSHSFAGIEKVEDRKYKIFYSVSPEDFASQSAIKGPFHVQYVIKYSVFSGKPVMYRGRVDTVDQLPETAEDGDLWYVGPVEQDNKEEYVWQGGKWELLGSTDFTNIYTKEEIDNKVKVIEADIDANADAIQKTRSDFMESDSELQQQINAHANEITTLKNDIDELGDQVAGIESKIPEGTSDTNPLINKQQLLDEEMDIRADMNEMDSQLQTQINALAEAIQGGGSAEIPDNVYTADNLVAGENVVFEPAEEKINGDVLGSLNITSDFVASGFSDDNVIIANDPINETSNLQSFEICTSFKLYSTTNCGIIDTAGSAGNARWRITLDGGVIRARTMFYASTVGDVDIYGTTYVQPGVKYNLKYAYLADTNNGMYGYRLWVLPEGEEFRPDNIQGFNPYVERPYISTTHNTIRLGDNSAGGNAMDGEMYLKDTYINVNSEMAWSAVAGGKTKVSAIIPPVELPDDVYRQTNLLGGKDIEIVPEPVEGGIDEYTLSCFHLDGTAVDEVTGYTLYPTMDNSVHKFGTGSSMWTNSTSFPWSLNSYESFSFDYWYYHKTSRSSYLGLSKTGYYSYLLGLYFQSGATKPNFYILSNKHGIDVDFEENKWTHVYVYYNAEDRSFHLFVNGKEVFSSIDATDFSGVKEFSNDGYTTSRFDEIRISKCIRWTEDFTPSTQPYRKAEPTGNYVINFTGKAGEVGGSNASFPLFYHTFADHILNDASWLRADTFSWQSGDMYVSAYNHLVADIEGLTAEVETIGSTEIIFYRAKDGHKIVLADQEDNVSAIYRATGVAWYYVLDTANKRFKLPRTKHAFAGIRTGVGNFVEAGLPNITGSFVIRGGYVSSASGAIKQSANANSQDNTGNGNLGNDGEIDASISSSVYGNSDTVQPPSTEQYLYFYVGNTVRNQTEVNVGAVTEQLNGKQDVLGNNVDYVVESYNDGTNWYRVYKSGWLEQGGHKPKGPDGEEYLIFLKPFKDINYQIFKTNTWFLTSNVTWQWIVFYSKTPTQATTYNSNQTTHGSGYDWYACGQGAF